MDRRVAIVGAGYAGMAAAAELAAAGRRVTVFEASRTLGGRARGVEIEGLVLDNGAHILAGAYVETLRLMRLVGADPERLLQRLPLRLEYPGQLRIAAPLLPAPLHLAWALLAAKGLSWSEKFAAIRFTRGLQAVDFRLPNDSTVAGYLAASGQPERLTRYLWEPLCVAALNTPIERASMQVFANVLRDSLLAGRAASDFLLPATDYSSLFPQPAAAFVTNRGGEVRREQRITTVTCDDTGFRLDDHGPFGQVVVAVAPQHLGRLIAGMPELADLAGMVERFAWEPIVTAYLAYPESVRLPQAMVGIAGGHAQWLFDRGRTHGQAGLVAAVISAHGQHESLDHDRLAAAIHGEIAALLPGLPSLRWHRAITERRATFACTPGLQRPETTTAVPGLWLAGDYVRSDYPATIEAAVRSGVAAARKALQPA